MYQENGFSSDSFQGSHLVFGISGQIVKCVDFWSLKSKRQVGCQTRRIYIDEAESGEAPGNDYHFNHSSTTISELTTCKYYSINEKKIIKELLYTVICKRSQHIHADITKCDS